jgi:HPt (histidine-containing phosphotransfer) domain-containing protein
MLSGDGGAAALVSVEAGLAHVTRAVRARSLEDAAEQAALFAQVQQTLATVALLV